jgi:hypothetical protein
MGCIEKARVSECCLVLLLGVSLGACASINGYVGDTNVTPEKFQYLRCKDIAQVFVATENKYNELRTLMDRAATGSGGAAVNLLVYAPQLDQVEAELRLLRRAAGEKRCEGEVTRPEPPKLSPLH